MFRKTYKVVVLAIVLGVLLNACSKRQAVTEEYNTISDLAYSEKCKIEPIIYIEEKTGFVPYIVLTNDYNGKTLLLRKEILPENRRVSDYSAYYEESEIDNYLMGEFFDNLPIQTRCLIQDSEIEILDERCLNQIDDSVITIVMSKVTFRSKQPYFQLSYMDVFRVGFITVPVVGGKPYKDNGKPNIDYAKCKELGIKDPDSVGSGYLFIEGADHNEITVENEDVIEGIRAYIASRNDYLIVELEDGKEPADPEGTVFECKTALYQLYPAIYKGVSTAEGKTFSFNRGEKQNRYITNDAEEIKILRDYIKTRVDNMFTEVKE